MLVEVPKMVVTQTVDDFSNVEAAKARGWYKLHYFCPVCSLEIATETHDESYVFGFGSVLKTNQFPRFCPDCGAPLVKPDEIKEEER